MKKTVSITYRSVAIEGKPETKHARTLADIGMSMRVICQETGLTPGQVQYRLKRGGLNLTNYRQKKNALSKYVVRRVYEMTRSEIKTMIKNKLLLAQ